MVGRLRDLENEYGLYDHHVVDVSDEKHVTKNLDKKAAAKRPGRIL